MVLLVGDMDVDLTDVDLSHVDNHVSTPNSLYFLPVIIKPKRFSNVNNCKQCKQVIITNDLYCKHFPVKIRYWSQKHINKP